MNRIVIDGELKNAISKNNVLICNINCNGNYTLNNLSKKYILNISNCNINIFSMLENSEDLNIEINIDNAKVIYNLISYDTKNQNIKVNLNSEHSSIEIFNSLVSISSQNSIINILHNSKKTDSSVYNFAATKDSGSITFDVTSKVLKGMKNSVVNQESKIISLNSSNNNKINPILLIDEFDAIAKHSAFIGKFKDEEVFYMQSRGIKKKDAYDLLLKGFLIGTLKIDEEEKNNIIKKYDNWR